MTDKAPLKISEFDSSSISESTSNSTLANSGSLDGTNKIGSLADVIPNNSILQSVDPQNFLHFGTPFTEKNTSKTFNIINESDENNMIENSNDATHSTEEGSATSFEGKNYSGQSDFTPLESPKKKSPFNPNAQEFFPNSNLKQGISSISHLNTRNSNTSKKITSGTLGVSPVYKSVSAQPIKAFTKGTPKKASIIMTNNTHGNNPFNLSKTSMNPSITPTSPAALSGNIGVQNTPINTDNQYPSKANIGNSSHGHTEIKPGTGNGQTGYLTLNNPFSVSVSSANQNFNISTNSTISSSTIPNSSSYPSTPFNNNDFHLTPPSNSSSPLLDPSRVNIKSQNETTTVINQPKRSQPLPINIRKAPPQALSTNTIRPKQKSPSFLPNTIENKISINQPSSIPINDETVHSASNFSSSNLLNKDFFSSDFDVLDSTLETLSSQQINKDKATDESMTSQPSLQPNYIKEKSSTHNSVEPEITIPLNSNTINSPSSPTLNNATSSTTLNNSIVRHTFSSWERIDFSGNFSVSTDYFLIVECNNQLYCCGNWNNSHGPAELFIYKYTDGKSFWNKVNVQGTPPYIRSKMVLLADQNKLYAFGGQADNVMDFYNILEFDLDNRIWSHIKIQNHDDLLLARQDFSVSLLNGVIYLFGGVFADNPENDKNDKIYFLNDFWSLNLKERCWKMVKSPNLDNKVKELPDIPQGRAGHSSVSYQNSLYIFGGSVNDTEFNDFYEYNTLTGSWSQVIGTGSIPPPRYCHSADVLGDEMIVFGGYGLENKFISDIHSYNFLQYSWTKIIFKNSSIIPKGRFRHYSATLDGHLFIFGGKATMTMFDSFSGGTNSQVVEFSDCFKINLALPPHEVQKTTKEKYIGMIPAEHSQIDISDTNPIFSKQLASSGNRPPAPVNYKFDSLHKYLEELASLKFQCQNLQAENTSKENSIKELMLFIQCIYAQLQNMQSENNKLQQEIERLKAEKILIFESKKLDNSNKNNFSGFLPMDGFINHPAMKMNPSLTGTSNNNALQEVMKNQERADSSANQNFGHYRNSKPPDNNDWTYFQDNFRPSGQQSSNNLNPPSYHHPGLSSNSSMISGLTNPMNNVYSATNNSNTLTNQHNIPPKQLNNALNSSLNEQNIASGHHYPKLDTPLNLSEGNVSPQDLLNFLMLSGNVDSKNRGTSSHVPHPNTDSTNFPVNNNNLHNITSQTNWDMDLSKPMYQTSLPFLNHLKNISTNQPHPRNSKKPSPGINNPSFNPNNNINTPSPSAPSQYDSNTFHRFHSSLNSLGNVSGNNQSLKGVGQLGLPENTFPSSQNQRQHQIWNNRFMNSDANSNFSKEVKDNIYSQGNPPPPYSQNNPPPPPHTLTSNLRPFMHEALSHSDFSKFPTDMSRSSINPFTEDGSDTSGSFSSNFRINPKTGLDSLQSFIEKQSGTSNNKLQNNLGIQNNQFSFLHSTSGSSYNNSSMFIENKMPFPSHPPPPPPNDTTSMTNNMINNLNLNSISSQSGNNFVHSSNLKNNFNLRSSDNSLSNDNLQHASNFMDLRRPTTQSESYDWNSSTEQPDDLDGEKYPDWA